MTEHQGSAPHHDTARTNADLCPSCAGRAGTVLFSSNDRFRGQPGTHELLECADCALVRVRPPALQDPATVNLEWIREHDPSPIVRRLINWGRQIAARPLATLVRRCGRSEGTVLDLGGGAFLGMQLRRADLKVVTAVPNRPPVNSLLRSAEAVVVQGRLLDACFRRGAFDVIVCQHLLEHEWNLRGAISTMLEMLDLDGSLVIQVPNANSWQAVLLAGAWAGFDVPRNHVTFDGPSLERLLDGCGLFITTRKPCSSIEAALYLATSLCPWLDPDLRQFGGTQEHRVLKELKDLCYCLVSVAVLPLVLLELASGSTPAILVEARRATASASESYRQQDDSRTWNPSSPTVESDEERQP